MLITGARKKKSNINSVQEMIFRCFRHLSLVTFCIAFVACSNGSDSPSVEEPGSAVTVIDGNGGNIAVKNLSLNVTPDALSGAQQISIETLTPEADELARFKLTPAGLRFDIPSELRFELPDLPATAQFFWLGPQGELTPFPSQVDGNVVTAEIRFLGYASQALPVQLSSKGQPLTLLKTQLFAPTAKAPDSDAASELIVKAINCEGDAVILSNLLSNLNNLDSLDEAQALFDRLSALLQSCSEISVDLVQQQSCDRLGEAVANANATIPADTDEFLRDIAKLMGASAMVQKAVATCSNVNIDQADAQVREKFVQMTAILQSRLLRSDLTGEDGADDLTQIFDLAARCQMLALGEICDSITETVIPDLLDNMRNSAFADCRTSNNQGLAVSQFYALGSEINDEETFLGFSRFSLLDIEKDLMYCTNPSISLKVIDDALTLPDELKERAATLRALGGLGSYNRTIRIEVPRDGSLTVSGAAAALRCPDESVSNADIVYRINNIEVARRSRNGLVYPLSSPQADLVLSRVLPIAGLDPENTSDFALKIVREGGLCTDSQGEILNDSFEIFEVNVVINPVVTVESEWVGTTSIEYSFSANWDQTINRTFSLECFFSTRADCEFGHVGQISGSLQLDIDQASSGVVPIGTSTDMNVSNIRVLGTLNTTQNKSVHVDNPGFCVIDGTSSLSGSANAAFANSAGNWRFRVSTSGLLELTNNDISTTFSGSTSGSSTQTLRGTNCGQGIPTGTFTQNFGPDPLNPTIHLLLQTFTGQVDPDSNEWRGTDTKTFNGRDGQCGNILTVPDLGGSPAPSSGVTCSVTARVSWNFTRQ